MNQIKIFKGVEGTLSELEADVNSFLKDLKGNVHGIYGNIAPQSHTKDAAESLGVGFAPSDVIVIVHYETA